MKSYHNTYQKHWESRQSAKAKKKTGVAGHVSWEAWQRILIEHRNRCHWCQRDLHESFLVLDHVIPLAEGGPHNDKNVVPACANCNHQRAWEMSVKHKDIAARSLPPLKGAHND